MRVKAFRIVSAIAITAVASGGLNAQNRPQIPKTWDDDQLHDLHVPLAYPLASPVHVSPEYYYKTPTRLLFKMYPVYAPGREPAGYIDWLKQQEPQVVFDAANLRTEEEWVRAGEIVFDSPNAFSSLDDFYEVRNPAFYAAVQPNLTPDGRLPYLCYVVRTKGKIEVGRNSCGTCHTRVMSDGTVVKGAQGNWAFDKAQAFAFRNAGDGIRIQARRSFATPWLQPDPHAFDGITSDQLLSHFAAIPAGVMSRTGTSIYHPVQVPDLIGVEDRKYLDHTGLVQQRSIGDLMRYAALNQGYDTLSSYGGFVPFGVGFKSLPAVNTLRARYSDEQLYAVALYIYSLKAPFNLNRNKLDARVQRGSKVFMREGCNKCHTAPLYTNNKLTPARGFDVPPEHKKRYLITDITVGTEPFLALKTRRGTGYYKVPSLKGLWYRGPLGHDGSVATLEDWLDPARLKDDYVPTGFKGAGVSHRAVPGHAFGMTLTQSDKAALIAFLKTL